MENNFIPQKEVVIKFSCLEDNDLSADLFILLHHKHHGGYSLPKALKEHMLENDHALKYLEEKGFIKITNELEYELRQKGTSLFEVSTPEQKWLEFLGTYPIKVPNGRGSFRILKSSSPTAKSNVKLRIKYLSIIKKNPDIHEAIMKALNAELTDRRKSNELQYMQGIDVYVNQQSYEKYEGIDTVSDVDYKNEDYV